MGLTPSHYGAAMPAAAHDLFHPDWTQLFPDLATGVTTGVVAGLVLFGVQRVDSQRAERRNADFLWQGLRSSVFMTAAQRSTISLEDLTVMPEWAEALDTLVASRPLGLWQSQLGYSSIAVLREAIERIQLLRAAAGFAEGDLQLAADHWGRPGFHRIAVSRVARQILRGDTDEQLHDRFGLSGENLENAKSSAKNLIGSIPDNRAEGYTIAVKRVAAAQDALLEQLRHEDKRLKPRELRKVLNGLNL